MQPSARLMSKASGTLLVPASLRVSVKSDGPLSGVADLVIGRLQRHPTLPVGVFRR